MSTLFGVSLLVLTALIPQERSPKEAFSEASQLRARGLWRDAWEIAAAGYQQADSEDIYRPYLDYLLAELEVQLGQLDRAHERRLRLKADEDGSLKALKPWLVSLESQVFRLRGLPERALPAAEQALRAAREAHAASPSVEASKALFTTQLRLIAALFQLAAHDRIQAELTAFLTEPHYENEAWRATMLYSRALSLFMLESRDPDRPIESLAALDDCDTLEADSDILVRRVLLRARIALRSGESTLARDVLDGLADVEEFPRQALQAWYDALRSDTARQSGGAAGELEQRRLVLEEDLETILADWEAEPPTPSGLGLLNLFELREFINERVAAELDASRREGQEEREGVVRALDVLDRVACHGTIARRLGVECDLAEALDRLRPGQGVLVYSPPAPGGSFVFALDRDSAAVGRLGSSHRIQPLCRDLHAELAAASDVRRERYFAGRVAQELWPTDVAAAIQRWSHVTVVGPSGFGYCPWAWLPLRDEPYAGVARTFEEAPALSVWADLAKRTESRFVAGSHSARADSVVLVAEGLGTEAGARWPELDPIELAEEQWSRFDEPWFRSLDSGTGSQTSLEDELKRDPLLAHLVAHGVRDEQRLRPGGLLWNPEAVADEAVLFCEDVETLAAPPLVALWSCGSGRGRERTGDAFAGDLTGAWFVAGSTAVVVAHMDLSLGDALDAVETFDRSLRAGGTPAEALQAVQLDVLDAYPDGSAVFHAGMLQVVGFAAAPWFDEREAATPRSEELGPRRRWVWVLGFASGLAVVAVGLGLLRRLRST